MSKFVPPITRLHPRDTLCRHRLLGSSTAKTILLAVAWFMLSSQIVTAQTSDTLTIDSSGVNEAPKEKKILREAPNRMPKKRIDAGEFRPRPMQAVWYSALFPGLGQVYNKKYWKIPIVVGGFVGIYYGYNWNGQNYNDYANAYTDAMDDNPLTKSYMDLLPFGTKEEDVDMAWLKDVLKRQKDYFRRNRDLCVIGMVALYGAAIIDAYVDASLYAFDISPELSMKVRPTLFTVPRMGHINTGMCVAFNF